MILNIMIHPLYFITIKNYPPKPYLIANFQLLIATYSLYALVRGVFEFESKTPVTLSHSLML